MKTTIDIFYQGEHVREVAHLEAETSHTIAAVKAAIIEKHGAPPEVLIFLEDSQEPLDDHAHAGGMVGPGGLKLHLHRCRHIEVTVAFAGETAHHKFAPGTTIAHVKRWAAERHFHMTAEEAGEHMLQLAGTHERPSPGTHIGALASCPACHLAFDLVPDERVNGAADQP